MGTRKSRLYIIGYFTVAFVRSFTATDVWPPPDHSNLLQNAHLRRNKPDSDLVIVSGHSRSSRLLDQAIAISDEAQFASLEFKRRIGVNGSLKRAIGRWVPSDNVANIKDWIGWHDETSKPQTRTLIYKRTHSGDPDPKKEYLGITTV